MTIKPNPVPIMRTARSYWMRDRLLLLAGILVVGGLDVLLYWVAWENAHRWICP